MGKRTTKSINLALQGGGAHGAYTWGVLDRLLEEDALEIAGMSGTSAGALNAAALKSGWLENGREGARAKLSWLWKEIGALDQPALPAWMTGITPQTVSRAMELSPAFMAADMMSRMMSPYQFANLMPHPLGAIVDQLSYDKVCAPEGPELFICATNVRTGKIRIFQGDEIDSKALLASGCLPTLFKAVEKFDPKTGQEEAFWDGGYMGNPALFPLFDNATHDIVIVNINPLHRDDIPKSPQEIQNRINEISFNGSLFRELRAIQFVRDLLRKGAVQPGTMEDVLVHMISDDALMTQLSVATKMVPTPYVLGELKSAGRARADAFLRTHWGDLNSRSTVDLRAMFS